MPGAHDQLANTPPGVDQASPREPDPVSPREPDPVIAELRERMERLPPGHPSSPFNDDGSRKPPPPDLSAYELPIPGDPDYQPEPSGASETDRLTDEAQEAADDRQHVDDKGAADEAPAPDSEAARPSDSEDEPRSRPDGSWEWQGRSLTPEESRNADQTLARWVTAEGRDSDGNYGEHGLTPAMRRIEARLEYGELAPDTEKLALKAADRLKLKLAERISLQPGKSADVLASRIHDGIRYTFEYDEQKYTSGTMEAEAVLSGSGYELITRKPSWDSPDYKGVNSQWRDPESNLLFEIQFHTHASWEAKQRTHLAYERLADPRTRPEERERLDAYQKEIAASVPVPPGALEIPYYLKKGG
jgi:hypothetical protein